MTERQAICLHKSARRPIVLEMAKKRITKVYTKTGDKGETLLIGGKKVSKASPRVDAYGDVDELNSLLGVAMKETRDEGLRVIIKDVQNDLFVIGAQLASPPETDITLPKIREERIKALEALMDSLVEELGPLTEFILPGGNGGGPYLHLARTVARRGERTVVRLMEEEEVDGAVLVYLNRLSDLLFLMARAENKRGGFGETLVDFTK